MLNVDQVRTLQLAFAHRNRMVEREYKGSVLACTVQIYCEPPFFQVLANSSSHSTLILFLTRYMVQWPGARILRRQELDAFLAQALSPKLYEPDQLQELKVPISLVSLSWEVLLWILV